MTVKRKAAGSMLVSIAVPYAEQMAQTRRVKR
jgi:hypothetical protein